MSVRTVPAQTITTCDVCGIRCTSANRRTETRLHLLRHALDHLGQPAADGSIRLDLCDSCARRIGGAINATAAAIRNGDTP